MFYFDPYYIMFMLPGVLLAIYASAKTKRVFKKYARVAASSGMTGAQAAASLLRSQNLHDVKIESTRGFLSDHYDPRTRTLRLSPDVGQSSSLSAVGVACHEAGHALQHAEHYAPLAVRSALVPVTQFGSWGSYILLILGFIFRSPHLIQFGILLFSGAVLFSLVTLPVEWNASARAKRLMVSAGIVTEGERRHAGAVLDAAFLTYVASAVTALLTLLYYIIRFGGIGDE